MSAAIAGSKRLRSRSWMREAFGEVARAQMPVGSKPCRSCERLLRLSASGAPSRSAIAAEIAAHIAGLVDLVDQRMADQAQIG